MAAVFADSGYFIATLNSSDPLHAAAVTVAEGLGSPRIVTTQMVLTEVVNYMSGGGAFLRTLAVQLVRELEDSPNVEVVPYTDGQFKAAIERYSSRSDQSWSLTDCASFLAMEERSLTRRWPMTTTLSRRALWLS